MDIKVKCEVPTWRSEDGGDTHVRQKEDLKVESADEEGNSHFVWLLHYEVAIKVHAEDLIEAVRRSSEAR